MTAQSQFLAKPTINPIEVLQDSRVVASSIGTLGAYMIRKAAFENFRNVFGVADKNKQTGEISYLQADENGNGIPGTSVPNAYVNRILFNLGTVMAGTLLIGQSNDPNLDYIGLGIAAGGAANVIMNVFQIS